MDTVIESLHRRIIFFFQFGGGDMNPLHTLLTAMIDEQVL